MIKDSHQDMVRSVDRWAMKTHQGHREARTRRDYVNNIQHSPDEKATLNQRKQPIVTDNRIKRKTDYFLGIERQTRTDPKAYPRTPAHEDAADAFTDAIRYVCDNSDWDVERSEGFDTLICEGIEGYSVPIEETPAGLEVRIMHIPWGDIIYDEESRDRYFRDSKRKGVQKWMDLDDAIALFPTKKDILEESVNANDIYSEDEHGRRHYWVNPDRNRVKIIQLYYQESSVWKFCIFTRIGYLIEPQDSPYKDEYGRPDCIIELAGAYVDRDNDRFGPVQDMMSLQDLVNKSESKYMHLVNQNQTWGNQQGPDANKAKTEAAKPDGHHELTGNAKFGEDFGIIPTDNKAIGTLNLLQTALTSLSEIGGNQLVDETASGRSKEVTQQTKLLELGPVLDTHRQCSKRVYRQVFNRIKQFKTDEWWVRVTDNEDNLKWTGLNAPMTYREAIEEKYGQIPPEAQNHPQLDEPVLDEYGEPVMIKNNVAEIDVDIIIEEAQDIVNIQQEQFQVLSKLAESYGPDHVPFEEVLKLSSLRNKDKFEERTRGSEQEQQQQREAMRQKQETEEKIQLAKTDSEIRKDNASAASSEADVKAKEAKAAKDWADAESQQLENEIVKLELDMGLANG